MTKRKDFLTLQKEYCRDQVVIDKQRNITLWALGGFVPSDPVEATHFLRHNPPYSRRVFSSTNTKYIKQFIKIENDFRLLLVQQLNQFLAALEVSSCRVGKACAVSGLSRVKALEYRSRIAALDELWYEVEEDITDRLEEAGFSRAVDGYEEPVFYQGEECGYKQKYSDSILAMMLQGRRPDVYKQRTAQEISTNGPIPVTIGNFDWEDFDEEDRLLIRKILEKRANKSDAEEEGQSG
jgi:hypothetical protein